MRSDRQRNRSASGQTSDGSGAASSVETFGLGMLVALGGIILVILAVRMFAEGPTAGALPAELRGVWVAEGAGYEGRTLELAPSQVILGQAEGQRTIHVLRGVVERESVLTRVFEVSYAMTDGLQVLEVHLHPDGTLRLRNPSEVVWRRQ